MKRVLHGIGALLCIAAVAFFAREIMATGLRLPPGGIGAAVGWLSLAALAYALAVLLLSLLWSLLLLGDGADRRSRADVAGSYLVSQFGKYLPGNVFQYVGRHALGRRLGLGHGALASAAVHEIVFMVAVASLWAAANVRGGHATMAWGRPALAVCGLAALAALWWAPRLLPRLAKLPTLTVTRFGLLVLGYLLFFLMLGALYWACLRLFGATVTFADASGSAALGWMAGFLVPGAPAGAGLREAALAVTLAAGAGAAVTSAIVAFRLVTMAGDFLAFLGGLGIRRIWYRPDAPLSSANG